MAPAEDSVREPVLVASGTIRIAREAALQKLKDYQAADPWSCLLEFVRCAHGCGAGRIEFQPVRRRALRIRFDGRAFGWSRLLDPFEALLRPGASDAGRHLAVGLLGALRVSKRVVLCSGRPPWRWRCRVRSLHELRLARAQGLGTFIDLLGVKPPRGWERALLASCRMARPRVFASGSQAVRGVGAGRHGRDFQTRLRRGRVELALDRSESSVEVYTRGVLVEAIARRAAGGVATLAWVEDDGLTLDASRLKLARNRRFRGLLRTVEEEERELLRAGSEKRWGQDPRDFPRGW